MLSQEIDEYLGGLEEAKRSTLETLRLIGYDRAKGTLRFPIDQALPRPLVEKLISVRLALIDVSAVSSNSFRRGASRPTTPDALGNDRR